MPFADQLIGAATAHSLYQAVLAAAPDADLSELAGSADRLQSLSLRARADLLRDALITGLPGGYASFAAVIRSAHDLGGLGGWGAWPVTSAAAKKAVDDGRPAAFDDSLALLAELTGLLTSEFAIRTLLRHDLDRALKIIQGWTESEDVDVRRLASEGTRPYLPWSVRVPEIIRRAGATVPILDQLYRDDSEYVRRSVANHLNDLSRDSPDIVVVTAARWLADPDEHTIGLVRRGLRTLVKRGDRRALELLGFQSANLEVSGPLLETATVPFGGEMGFRATVSNVDRRTARVSVDYTVHHVKANGTRTGKTFKLTTLTLSPGEQASFQRRHSFRELSTRRYYPGTHAIELHLNGVSTGPVDFELLPPSEPVQLQ